MPHVARKGCIVIGAALLHVAEGFSTALKFASVITLSCRHAPVRGLEPTSSQRNLLDHPSYHKSLSPLNVIVSQSLLTLITAVAAKPPSKLSVMVDGSSRHLAFPSHPRLRCHSIADNPFIVLFALPGRIEVECLHLLDLANG